MKQNKPLILTDYLSVGEENAITTKELSRLLGWCERDITIQIILYIKSKANATAFLQF